jgi:hypothetical protein
VEESSQSTSHVLKEFDALVAEFRKKIANRKN